VGFGAMAASSTKSDTTLADPAELGAWVEQDPTFPVYPIGGLHPGNLHLLDLGADRRVRRLAVSSALLDADDPAAAAHALLEWCGPTGS
jgi:thiamine monophosphate synthase